MRYLEGRMRRFTSLWNCHELQWKSFHETRWARDIQSVPFEIIRRTRSLPDQEKTCIPFAANSKRTYR